MHLHVLLLSKDANSRLSLAKCKLSGMYNSKYGDGDRSTNCTACTVYVLMCTCTIGYCTPYMECDSGVQVGNLVSCNNRFKYAGHHIQLLTVAHSSSYK